MIKFYKNNRGQSLIELSVAIGLTSMALLAIISLVLIGIVTQRKSANYYIAINLAREAIETARNIRDTNWLIREKEIKDTGVATTLWDNYLYNGNIYSAILKFLPETDLSSIPSRLNFEFIDPVAEKEKTIIYEKKLTPGETTVYLDYSCVDCQKTNFKRLIHLKPICNGDTGYSGNHDAFLAANGADCPEDTSVAGCEVVNPPLKPDKTCNFICENNWFCNDLAPKIGIRAVVEINWTEGGRTNNLKLVDDIYNWR
ncbi:MAG: type II secretion system protein [bacterium]